MKNWLKNIWIKFRIGWNKLINKLKFIGIVTTIAGTGVVAGTEIGKPECDYVIFQVEQEICLTEEQVNEIYRQIEDYRSGFGNVEFGGRPHLFEKIK